MKPFDYIVVGAGLFGATFAHEAATRGYKVKVIEKRNHIAGNIYTKEVEGIQVHEYGAHIFHTSDKKIWIMYISLRHLIAIRILQLRTSTVRFTTYHLT